MSETVANYQKIIQILSESQFRDFILLYHKEYYSPCEATFVDGPYDGGIDVEVRRQRREEKYQVQITIQATDLENKIMKDVDKAAANCNKDNRLDTLYFFVNQSVSYSKQMELRNRAQEKGISLHIHDSKFLAERVSEYPLLMDFLSRILDVAFPDNDSFDSNIQIVYDAVSQQRGIKAIKDELIKVFFLKVLYDKKEATIAEISNELDNVFLNVVRHDYYEAMAGKLKGVYIESKSENKPKKYYLLPEAKDYISSIYFSEKAKILEVRNRLEEVSLQNGLSLKFDDIYPFIEKLYDDNFNLDIETTAEEIEKHLSEFTVFIKEKCKITQEQAEKASSDFIGVFEINDYAGKQSASKMLLSMFRDNRLERYLSSKERRLLFDTPVLIQYICYLFKDLEDYPYSPYQYVRSLIKAIDDPRLNAQRFTLEGYLKEVVSHLSSAILVGRFLEIPEIRSLGKSKNSFYNFYKEVLSREDVGSIEDYICDVLGLDMLPDTRSALEAILQQTLRERMGMIGLDVKRRFDVDNWMDYKKDYDYALVNTSGERKSNNARINDLNAILYLSYALPENDNYLVTWDTSFERARAELKKKHLEMSDWYLYSPQQLAGTFSLLNFKINPSFVTGNILSLVEGTLASNTEAKSFVDTVSEFLKGSSDSQMKVARNLARIRSALFKADVTSGGMEDERPVDDILTDVFDYTIQDDTKYELFVAVMESDDFIQGMVDILSKHLELVEKGDYDKDALYQKVEEYLSGIELS